MTEQALLQKVRNGEGLSVKEQIQLVILLSIPSILAQISSIAMQYIDASMVGTLGADASASVGLVSTTTWLTTGLCQAVCIGFTVKVAFRIGAKEEQGARETVKYGLLTVYFFSLIMMCIAVLVHRYFMAPVMMRMLTPDEAVRTAGIQVLRTICFAEPLYGASIVAEGVFRGRGETGIPTVLNLISMWCVRIPLSAYFARRFGLFGVWRGQGIELCFRGTIYLLALHRKTKYTDTVSGIRTNTDRE